MQRVAGTMDASTIKNILFTAGLSKARCCRVIYFLIGITKPERMEGPRRVETRQAPTPFDPPLKS
jgi:hypothetical protein